MKTLVEHLIAIREHLSDKERWEECYDNNKITGYCSGSLGNDLAGVWNAGDNIHYAAAYDCVAKAINNLFGDCLEAKIYRIDLMTNDSVPVEQYTVVRAFGERRCHKDLMKVLDLAVRYAKVYVFT